MEKTIQQLNLSDDFLFAKVMADSEICRRVLEKILTVPIRKVEAPTTQRTIDLLFEGKGVRLDVYVNDDEGTVYNIEMQCNKKRNLPKRTRYYAGSIDLDLIAAVPLIPSATADTFIPLKTDAGKIFPFLWEMKA